MRSELVADAHGERTECRRIADRVADKVRLRPSHRLVVVAHGVAQADDANDLRRRRAELTDELHRPRRRLLLDVVAAEVIDQSRRVRRRRHRARRLALQRRHAQPVGPPRRQPALAELVRHEHRAWRRGVAGVARLVTHEMRASLLDTAAVLADRIAELACAQDARATLPELVARTDRALAEVRLQRLVALEVIEVGGRRRRWWHDGRRDRRRGDRRWRDRRRWNDDRRRQHRRHVAAATVLEDRRATGRCDLRAGGGRVQRLRARCRRVGVDRRLLEHAERQGDVARGRRGLRRSKDDRSADRRQQQRPLDGIGRSDGEARDERAGAARAGRDRGSGGKQEHAQVGGLARAGGVRRTARGDEDDALRVALPGVADRGGQGVGVRPDEMGRQAGLADGDGVGHRNRHREAMRRRRRQDERPDDGHRRHKPATPPCTK